MIYKGYTVKASFPKQIKEGRCLFKVGDKDKQTNKWHNFTFITENPIELEHHDEVVITGFNGVGLTEYKGELQVTVSGNVMKVGEKETVPEPKEEPVLNITGNDLPF